MAPFLTPLRYPGGKTKLFPYVSQLFKLNALLDGHYVEPYAGGAGLAMSLLLHGYARYIHLNDIDRSIYALWHCVLNETDSFCEFINDVDISLDEWKRQKSVQDVKGDIDLFTLGKSTLFLNRTNRSGVLNGGVIGGILQNGKYKIDARFNRESLIFQIKRIALYKSRIKISNLDAMELLNGEIVNYPDNTLIYLDPPYYVNGKKLYKNSYTHNDHDEISKVIKNIKFNWIVTYDNVEQIRDLYSDFTYINFKLNYSLHTCKEGEEIFIANKKLILPDASLLNKLN